MEDTALEKSRFVVDHFAKAAAVYDYSPVFPLCGQRLVDLAEIPDGARVLDIATGTGAVLFPAADRIGPAGHVIGIDIAAPMVARTNAKIIERKVANAEVRQGDAQALDFADASFDVLLCGFALWFIPDLTRALREMYRVLRPGGRLAASTWGPPGDLARLYRELFASYGGHQPELGSHSLVAPEAVRDALVAAGFEISHLSSEDVSVVSPDEQQWWEQRMAGPQVNEATLAPNVLAKFKEEAFKMLQPFKRPEGIHETRNAIFVVAISP